MGLPLVMETWCRTRDTSAQWMGRCPCASVLSLQSGSSLHDQDTGLVTGFGEVLMRCARLISYCCSLLFLVLKILVELLRFKPVASSCFGADITGLPLNPSVYPSHRGAISIFSVNHPASSLSFYFLQRLYV